MIKQAKIEGILLKFNTNNYVLSVNNNKRQETQLVFLNNIKIITLKDNGVVNFNYGNTYFNLICRNSEQGKNILLTINDWLFEEDVVDKVKIMSKVRGISFDSGE